MNRSEIMGRIKSKNTKPEIALFSLLEQIGISGIRKHWGKPKTDLVIPEANLAIFLDFCFWHKCPKHGIIPRTNSAWWKKKLNMNAKRDKVATMIWKARGWKVLR